MRVTAQALLVLPALLLPAAAAQACDNPFSPVQDWTWIYRSQSTDKSGKVQTNEWQVQTTPTEAGFDTISSSGKQSSKAPSRCMNGAQVSMALPAVSGAEITKATSTGFSIPAPANWRVGYEWNMVWNVEGRRGLLRGTGDFTTRYRILGRERVKVAAGEFDAFKVEQVMTLKGKAVGIPLSQTMPTAYAWYAENVGLVRQEWGKGNVVELVNLKK